MRELSDGTKMGEERRGGGCGNGRMDGEKRGEVELEGRGKVFIKL